MRAFDTNEFRDPLQRLEHLTAEHDRGLQLKEWALNVLCWDGALPFGVIIAPKIVALFFARQGALEITFVVVPVIAFVVRYIIGWSRFKSRQIYIWQLLLFFVAILLLFVLDAALVMWSIVKKDGTEVFWRYWLAIYAVYLVIVAVAMYPARTNAMHQAVEPRI